VWYDETAGIPAARARRWAILPRTNSVGECTMSGRNSRRSEAIGRSEGRASLMSGYPGMGALGMAVVPALAPGGDSAGKACVRGAGYLGATTATSHPRSRRPLTLRAVTTETPFTWGGQVSVPTSRRGGRDGRDGIMGLGRVARGMAGDRHGRITAPSRGRHAGCAVPGKCTRQAIVRHSSGTSSSI
jgi:hypothetical protein